MAEDGRRVVYTCTFPDYDQIFSPARPTAGARHVLLAPRRPRFVRGWAWRPLPAAAAALPQFFANRWCKFFPQELFPEAAASVYVDGNILLLDDLGPLFDAFEASGADVALFPHPTRRTAFEELDACLAFGKLTGAAAETAARRVAGYGESLSRNESFLFANAVIFRRHDSPALAEAMRLWWAETKDFTRRDQISLPYVLRRAGLSVKVWDFFYRDENRYFHQYNHRGNLVRDTVTFAQNKARLGGPGAALFGGLGRTLEGALTLGGRLAGRGGSDARAPRDPRARR